METNERPVELAGVNLAGQNHVCAFFNTMDEEHRVLRSFYKGGFERGEKATHIVASENREAYLKRLTDARGEDPSHGWAIPLASATRRAAPR